MMDELCILFGYPCGVCGEGVMRRQVFPSWTYCLLDEFITVQNAQIGVCDACGALDFSDIELDRVTEELEKSREKPE